jgi:hypothetical protein
LDPRALEKARSRLRNIEKAIRELEEGVSFEGFTDIWFTFLTAYKSIYTTLEQGAKSSPQSQQWFDAKASERRGDELLLYLYQARNDEEHGLEDVTKPVPGKVALEIKVPDSLQIDLSNVQFAGDRARLPNGDTAKVIENILPHIILVPVRDRKRKEYHPPAVHLNAELQDASLLGVARLAYAYMERMVKEAEGLK